VKLVVSWSACGGQSYAQRVTINTASRRYSDYYGPDGFALFRFNADLSDDASFGPWGNGANITDPGGNIRINVITLQSNDYITAASYANI
jgi:hypothetical protein